MIIDSRDLSDSSQIDCDICIVGTGPAGITLANELAGTGVQVCLAESGGLTRKSETQTSSVAEELGNSVEVVDFQTRHFGGASNAWGGLLGRSMRLKQLDPIDLEARDWVPNSGWPLEYGDLDPFYERAYKLLNHIPQEAFTADQHHGQLLRAFHDDVMRTTIYHLPKPIRFGKRFRSSLALAQNIRVLLHSPVVEIEEAESESKIKFAHVVTPAGHTHRIAARCFALACGGLENPRLLLGSTRKRLCGVGNEHDLVGRYYMQHPKGRHGFILLNKGNNAHLYTGGYQPNSCRVHAGVSISEHVQRRDRLLNHCVMLFPALSLTESYASERFRELRRAWREGRHGIELIRQAFDPAVDWPKAASPALKGLMRHFAFGTTQLRAMNHMEQIPDAESRVELSEERDSFGVQKLRTNWRIHPVEKDCLYRFHALLQGNLERYDMGHLDSKLDPHMQDWPVASPANHHMGTTRMHNDPRQGVTDSNCRIHSVQNLFVAGSSVFPTSGHANPGLTIVAMSIRLADHLKALMKSKSETRAI